MEPRLRLSRPDLWGRISNANVDKYNCMNWARGLSIFALEIIIKTFCWGFCIFHSAIYWMKLERSFSMLAPTQPQLCLLLFLKPGLRHFYICWDFRLFLFLSHHCCQQSWALPQSSLGFILLFFFFTFYITFSHRHATLEICQVVWIPDSFRGSHFSV